MSRFDRGRRALIVEHVQCAHVGFPHRLLLFNYRCGRRRLLHIGQGLPHSRCDARGCVRVRYRRTDSHCHRRRTSGRRCALSMWGIRRWRIAQWTIRCGRYWLRCSPFKRSRLSSFRRFGLDRWRTTPPRIHWHARPVAVLATSIYCPTPYARLRCAHAKRLAAIGAFAFELYELERSAIESFVMLMTNADVPLAVVTEFLIEFHAFTRKSRGFVSRSLPNARVYSPVCIRASGDLGYCVHVCAFCASTRSH